MAVLNENYVDNASKTLLDASERLAHAMQRLGLTEVKVRNTLAVVLTTGAGLQAVHRPDEDEAQPDLTATYKLTAQATTRRLIRTAGDVTWTAEQKIGDDLELAQAFLAEIPLILDALTARQRQLADLAQQVSDAVADLPITR